VIVGRDYFRIADYIGRD